MSRVHPRVVHRQLSPNRSSRRGALPRLIVLHSTEGANVPGSDRDLLAAAAWLCRPEVDASAHVIVDGDGHSARLVADADSAWTQRAYNRVSLSIEQVGLAGSELWTVEELRETARWVARWSRLHRIPIRRARVEGLVIVEAGVCRHSDLRPLGGTHTDPGDRYPFAKVLELARYFRRRL